MNSSTAVKDPVCGMDVETAKAAGHAEHKGQTYYFCSSTCKTKFELRPEQYTSAAAAATKKESGS